MAYQKKVSITLFFVAICIAILVFLKNAWVTEDAYIIFRSIEQLFAGNGPVWNPHERVQAFTSPLWYYVLALVRIFSKNVYINVIFVSFVIYLSIILVLRKILKDNLVLLIAVLLFSASTSFHDYTSSGLENILGYFLVTLYLYNYFELYNINASANFIYRIKNILILFGLIVFLRHDLALILLPATVYVVFDKIKIFSAKQWVWLVILAFLPFILYSAFSTIYYGFPFPNTAYAKLSTGIDKTSLFKQGIYYFYSSWLNDSITLALIIGVLILVFFKASKKFFHYLGYGIILNMFYVCYVGGDFMQGRFFSFAYLIAAILLLSMLAKLHSEKIKLLALLSVSVYVIFYTHTPFNSPLHYSNYNIEMGIADERGFYFPYTSLYSYLSHEKGQLFPKHSWAEKGYQFRKSSNNAIVIANTGLFGYHAGNEKIIVDVLALSDPLLARLPVPAGAGWRIGHFKRKIPDGYIASIISGNERITNANINQYYKKLKIVTQSDDLLSLDRFEKIILFNLGAYESLLAAE